MKSCRFVSFVSSSTSSIAASCQTATLSRRVGGWPTCYLSTSPATTPRVPHPCAASSRTGGRARTLELHHVTHHGTPSHDPTPDECTRAKVRSIPARPLIQPGRARLQPCHHSAPQSLLSAGGVATTPEPATWLTLLSGIAVAGIAGASKFRATPAACQPR